MFEFRGGGAFFLDLLVGGEAFDGHESDVREGHFREQGDDVILLLADARVAHREDLHEAEDLVPGQPGPEDERPHSVAEEPEDQRAFALALEVDDLAAEHELERAHLELDGAAHDLERPRDPGPEVAQELAHGFVVGVVEREAAGGAREGEERRVHDASDLAAAQPCLFRQLGGWGRGRWGDGPAQSAGVAHIRLLSKERSREATQSDQ
jgi:hypothetical protein